MHIWVTTVLYHEIVLFQTYHAHVLGMDLSTNMINFALKAYESSKSSQVCEEKQWFFFSANLEIFCVTWSKNNIHLLYWKGPIWSKWCLNKRVPCWKIWCSVQQRDHSSYKGQKSPSQEDSGETYLAYF